MPNQAETTPKQGAHVDIPQISSIAGRVAVHNDSLGRSVWARGGSLLVFVMAAALVVLPLLLVVLLLRQTLNGPENLIWLWISMLVISEIIAFMVAYGLIHSVLEAEA
jgi:hypothetical protein